MEPSLSAVSEASPVSLDLNCPEAAVAGVARSQDQKADLHASPIDYTFLLI